MNNIFISTGGKRNLTAIQAANNFWDMGIKGIELSGGKYFENPINNVIELDKKGINLQIHNYFPVPKDSFVLNLASDNNHIIERSIEHCKGSIKLASQLKNKRFSVHAGFCCDPNVNRLGRPFEIINTIDHNKYFEMFVTNIIELKKYSDSLNVDLYIENNVVIRENIYQGKSVLLCTEMSEMKKLKELTGIKLLIDTGHLIVSSKSLGLEEDHQMYLASEISDAYHISSNNRLRDQNQAISTDIDLLKKISKNVDFHTLEVYSNDNKLIKDYNLLIDFLND